MNPPTGGLLTTKRDATGRSGNAQEDFDRTIQPHQILVGEAADTRGDLRLWNGRDLIHHQSADGAQTVGLTRLDRRSKQSRIGNRTRARLVSAVAVGTPRRV